MDFGILGPLTVRDGEADVVINRAKPRAVLVRLLLDANRAVSADRLIEDLWEGNPPPSAGQTMQSYVSQLRKAIGPERLLTGLGGYRLVAAHDELDVRRFEDGIAEGRRALADGSLEDSARAFSVALELWRGAPMSDAAGADWAAAEVARLGELRLGALESLLQAQIELGGAADVVPAAEAAVSEHPLRERLWAILVTALYREGRQGDALAACRRLRKQLADELGIDPSPELRELERRVLAQDEDLAATSARRSQPGLPTGVVTFLLTDIEHSTQLWERAAQDMAGALARHDAIIRSAVEVHGGVVLKARGEGDSTFSVFQRATDAVAASRGAQAGLAHQQWPEATPIRVRIAIHTGEALERDGDYYGPAVNRVARLRGIAEAGQILLTQATAALVADNMPEDCRLVDLGVLELRDLGRPETVYLLSTSRREEPAGEEDLSRPPYPSGLAASRPFFAGRADQLDRLADRLKRVSSGERALVLLAGEPGIGKTALAAEAARAAHAAGATVLYGRCDEDLSVPYRPWVEALDGLFKHTARSVLDSLGPKRLGQLARLVDEIPERLPGVRQVSSGDPDADRYQFFGAVAAALEAASTVAPLVLVLDDLHWADKASLQLLRHVVASTGTGRVLVLATYRDSELWSEHPLADVLAALRREASVERMRLSGLQDDELIELVQRASGHDPGVTESEFMRAIRLETDGNPFFVWETIVHLAETGVVSLDDRGRWVLQGTPDKIGLPDSVREVVGRRVARLGAETSAVLATAAVIGREFDLDTLAAALGGTEDDVLGLLEAAEAASLVASVAPREFKFAHALVADALYADLGPTRRSRAHRLVAEAIERVGRAEARVAELARHWSLTAREGDLDKAIHYALAAGNRARRSLAPDEALRWFRHALELVDAQSVVDEPKRCEVLVLVGRAQRLSGEPGFRETLLEAARLAQRIGDVPQLVRAALANNQGIFSEAGEGDAERVGVLETALDAVGPGRTHERARLLATLAAELAYDSDPLPRKAMSDEALEIARELAEPLTLVQVLSLRFTAIWIPEHLEERKANLAEAEALAEATGSPAAVAWAVGMRYLTAVESGDPDEMDRTLERYVAAGRDVGSPLVREVATMYRSVRALLAGNVDEAEALRLELARLSEEGWSMPGRPSGLLDPILVAVLRHRGRMPEALDTLESRTPEEIRRNYQHHSQLAMVRAAAGQVEAGRSALNAELDSGLLEESQGQMNWLDNVANWADAAVMLDHVEAAERLYPALLPYRESLGSQSWSVWSPVALVLGRLAVLLGRDDAADVHLERAEAIAVRLRAPFFIATTRLERGRLFLRRRETEQAAALLMSARDIAAQYGCGGIERDANALLQSSA